MNGIDIADAPGQSVNQRHLALLVAILFFAHCSVEEHPGGPWVAVAHQSLPEAGIHQWTIYRKTVFGRHQLDDLVARFRVYGDCIVYEKITTTDLYRVACGNAAPVKVIEDSGEWLFGADGLQQDRGLTPEGDRVVRIIAVIDARSLLTLGRGQSRSQGEITLKHLPVNVGTTAHGDTPLVEAVLAGDARTVKALIGAGADPNVPGDPDRYPIVLAAYGGNTEVARALLDAGARLDVTTNWVGPVTAAADRNDFEMVKLLIATHRYADGDLRKARSHARDSEAVLSLLPDPAVK